MLKNKKLKNYKIFNQLPKLKTIGGINFFLIFLFLLLIWNLPLHSQAKKVTKSCGLTTRDQLGPFYVSGVPIKNNLLEKNDSSNQKNLVELRGRIIDHLTKEPIENAKMEIWHADSKGDYWPENNGRYTDYRPEQIKYRGTALSDREGEFSFSTIIPQLYGSRPRHYHVRVSAANFRTLITQYYLKIDETDERRIKRDSTARRAEACRILTINPQNGKNSFMIEIQLSQD